MLETRPLTNSAVGEAAEVDASVGMITSVVEVGMAVGGILVETGLDVDSIIGAGVAVQAVRRIKVTMMDFFITNIICHCEEGAIPDDTCAGTQCR
jgi:hypothetical protein